MNLIHTIMMAGLFLSSCHKTGESELAEMNIKNVKYGTNAAQSMDVYLPAGRTVTNTKVVIFVHGGSWNAGDKADFNTDINNIRPRLNDYAIFNINYRLAVNGQNRYPNQLQDIALAIDYIKSNATEYNIDPTKIGLIGASAGAHLSMLYAYKNNSNGNIKAVVDLFGPTNLTALYNNHPVPAASQPVLQNFMGTTPSANASLYSEASPINFVTAQSPATLILHGDADYIVPISQSTALRSKFQAVGGKFDMHTYVGEGHGWFGATLNDTYNRTIAFLKENVQ